MILSTHFLAGAAIASYTDSPILIIILPFLFHFLLDMVPHWEYVDAVDELKQKIPQLAADILAGPLIVLIFALLVHSVDTRIILWLFLGGTISVIPDGLSLLHMAFPKNKFLKRALVFHLAVHSKRKLGRKVGLAFQVALDILATALIVLPKV